MMMWIVRGVRGAFLVALVFVLVVSSNYLLGTAKDGPIGPETTKSAPSAAIQSALAVVDDAAGSTDPTADADATLPGDSPTLDQPTDLSPDLVDADQPAARSADSDSPPLDTAIVDPGSSGSSVDPSPTGTAAPQGPYKRIDVAKLSYGKSAANIGLLTGAERRPTGPASFAVDPAGAFYVSDNVNNRIQVFSAQGQHQRSLTADAEVHDLVAGDSGLLYLLSEDGEVMVEDSATGNTIQKWSIADQAGLELGKLRMTAGQIAIETPRQITYPLAAPLAQGSRPLTTQEQVASQKAGALTLSQSQYSTTYRDGGHLYRLDASGKPVQDILLDLSDIATVVFLNEDRAGNAYVQVERVAPSGEVSVEVRQYTKKGELTAVVPLDRVDYLPMTKTAIVTEDGVIYQFAATEQGVVLAKWQRS